MDQTPKDGVEFLGMKFSAILPVVGEGGTVDAVSAEWTVGDVFADNNHLRVTAKVDGSDVETILSVSAVKAYAQKQPVHIPPPLVKTDVKVAGESYPHAHKLLAKAFGSDLARMLSACNVFDVAAAAGYFIPSGLPCRHAFRHVSRFALCVSPISPCTS